MSVPADTELAAMLVPSCARAKAAARAKTAMRERGLEVALSAGELRIWARRSRGFQTVVPKMTVEEEETAMPMKDVVAKLMGIVRSWGQRASLGWRAKREKSGLLTMTVAKFAMLDMMAPTMPHARSEPWAVAGWWMIGPMPLAL